MLKQLYNLLNYELTAADKEAGFELANNNSFSQAEFFLSNLNEKNLSHLKIDVGLYFFGGVSVVFKDGPDRISFIFKNNGENRIIADNMEGIVENTPENCARAFELFNLTGNL